MTATAALPSQTRPARPWWMQLWVWVLVGMAAGITLGPTGRNVILDKSFGGPTVTKAGVTVSKEIDLPDPFENMGAKLVNAVAQKTSDVAGDGTSTATILARLDYRSLAHGWDVAYQEINTMTGLEQSVRAALAHPGPLLVRVVVDYRGRPIRWISAVRNRVTRELTFDTLPAYREWRRRGRRAARGPLRKGDFLLWVTGNHLGALPVYEELGALAGDLLKEYATNAVAADQKYKGKVLKVTGKFATAQKAPLLGYAVQLQGDENADVTVGDDSLVGEQPERVLHVAGLVALVVEPDVAVPADRGVVGGVFGLLRLATARVAEPASGQLKHRVPGLCPAVGSGTEELAVVGAAGRGSPAVALHDHRIWAVAARARRRRQDHIYLERGAVEALQPEVGAA